MEKIKQALERARAQRNENGHAESTAAGAIRQIHIDWEHLREARILTPNDPNDLFRHFPGFSVTVAKNLKHNNGSSIAIISANRGEGKTVLAANLAISMAVKSTNPVVLIDASAEEPSLSQYLDLTDQLGLTDYLIDSVPLTDALSCSSEYRNLFILGSGKRQINELAVLSQDDLSLLNNELNSIFNDVILIYDTPSFLHSIIPTAFSGSIDRFIVVVEDGVTSKADVGYLLKRIDTEQLQGSVLNKSRQQFVS